MGLMSASTRPVRTWPLVGRLSELEQIARARAEGASGVVVQGLAGVGRSRVAREALAEAKRDGAQTIWVQATRSVASVPLGAFADVIPTEVQSDDLFQVLRGSVRALSEIAGERSLVLGIDDAQLLDQTSAALVLHLATTATGFSVTTVRTGEQCPDAIVSLWKDTHTRRLELEALDEDETGELVEQLLDGPVEQRLRSWVWDTSRGNALYVRELTLGALSGGALRQVSGLWRMQVRPSISATLAQLISARTSELRAEEYRVLELLALAEPLRLSEAIELAGREPLAAAESRGLIVVEGRPPDAEVRLAHPLYGATIAAALPSVRAREIRVALAAALRARDHVTPQDRLRIARWLLDAGEPVPTALLLEAARVANLSGDPDLAAELASAAAEAGAGIDAALVLARAHAVRNRFEEAERVLAEFEGTIDSQDVAGDYLEQRAASVLYWGLKRPDEARALLERAREWWPDQPWQRRLDLLRLYMASVVDSFGGTVAASEEILADPELDQSARRQLEPVHALNLFSAGRVMDAYELIRRIRPAVPLRNQSEELALIALGMISIESGQDLALNEREMRETLAAGIRAGDRAGAGTAALILGWLAFLAGRYVDARRWLAESEVHFERQDPFGTLVIVRAAQVGVAHFTGDVDFVPTALARCEEALQGHEPLPNQHPYVVRARAWATDALGDRSAAQRILLDGAARQANTIVVFAAQLQYEAMRVGVSAGKVAPPLSDLRERCDARLVAAYAGHATARARQDGQALVQAADEFERIGTLTYASEAAADAARIFLEAGRADSARRAGARSADLLPRGQGGTPPPIDGLDGIAVELTPREAQLIELARRGMSNAEIAERLVLSVRTVESHIYRAMQKLDIADRLGGRGTGPRGHGDRSAGLD